MQVNSAQNNNTSFQALKINSKLKSELEKLSLQQIKAIKKLGEDVKGVRHYDVCFEDNIVTPKIRRTKSRDKKDYLQEFRDEEKLLGKHCKVKLNYLTYERLLPYGIQASQKYAEFKKQNEFKQIANLAKFLEKDEINKRNEVKTANIKHATKHSKVAAKALELKFAVEELMHNHQYKAPNKLLSWLFD